MKTKILTRIIPLSFLLLGIVIGLIYMYPAMASDTDAPLYEKNEMGLTYGTMEFIGKSPTAEPPDLVACKGIDGTIGYCYKSDLDGDPVSTPEEASKYMEELNKKIAEANKNGEEFLWYIPLYKSDGKTVIGEFGISIPVVNKLD